MHFWQNNSMAGGVKKQKILKQSKQSHGGHRQSDPLEQPLDVGNFGDSLSCHDEQQPVGDQHGERFDGVVRRQRDSSPGSERHE